MPHHAPIEVELLVAAAIAPAAVALVQLAFDRERLCVGLAPGQHRLHLDRSVLQDGLGKRPAAVAYVRCDVLFVVCVNIRHAELDRVFECGRVSARPDE